jgi:FkbM family methyltransferase
MLAHREGACAVQVPRQVRQAATDLGFGPALRMLWQRVDPTARRNHQDDQHLALLLSFVLSKDANCIDIGAHRGDVLRVIVEHAPRGRHIAFEPLPHLFERLTTEFPTVDVRRSALADRAGTSSFSYVRSRPAYSGLRQSVPPGAEEIEEIEVEVETLDEAVPADYRPTLIKIDVEGAEYQVFKGGQHLLAAHRPYLVFEFGGAAKNYNTTPDDMYALVDGDLGLRIYDMDGVGPYTATAFRAAFHTGRRFNFVAHA